MKYTLALLLLFVGTAIASAQPSLIPGTKNYNDMKMVREAETAKQNRLANVVVVEGADGAKLLVILPNPKIVKALNGAYANTKVLEVRLSISCSTDPKFPMCFYTSHEAVRDTAAGK